MIIVRDALECDLEAIVAIFNAAIPTRLSTAQLETVTLEERLPWFQEHTPDRHPIWVAEESESAEIMGWLDFHPFLTRCAYRGTAELSVYVEEAFRRRGVAQRLLEAAITRAPQLELHILVGVIFGHNQPSLRLFERTGFARWGVLPKIARLDGVERDLVIVGRDI